MGPGGLLPASLVLFFHFGGLQSILPAVRRSTCVTNVTVLGENRVRLFCEVIVPTDLCMGISVCTVVKAERAFQL